MIHPEPAAARSPRSGGSPGAVRRSNRSWGAGLSLALALTLASACSAATRTAPPEEPARMAIRGLWDEINAALIAKDWDRYARSWYTAPN